MKDTSKHFIGTQAQWAGGVAGNECAIFQNPQIRITIKQSQWEG